MSARRSFLLPLLAAALGLVLSAPAFAYVIFLKDGTRLVAAEKPTVQGDRLVFSTNIGTVQSVPVADFDAKRTEEANKLSAGDAYVLDTPDGKFQLETVGKKPTLSEYIKKHNGQNLVMKDEPKGDGRDARSETPADRKTEKALAAGDAAQGVDPVVNDTFLRALEASGIRGPHIVPINRGVRIQALTDTEQQVFAALGGIARGMKESRAAGRQLDMVEVWLGTTSGQSAGHFEMSAEDADSLLNGKVGAAKYFVANVMF
jgi:hypothetical protein